MLLIVTIIAGSLAVLGLIFYLFLNMSVTKIKRTLFWLGGTVLVGVLIILLYRFSGSFLWTWMVFLIPLILRWKRVLQQFKNAAKTVSGPSTGQVSSVNTDFLEMNLHHDTGEMTGLIKKGTKKGKKIEHLDLNSLFEFLEETNSDATTTQLIERFLDKKYGEEWRNKYKKGEYDDETNNNTSSLSRSKALEILGLVEPVTEQQIKEAHRRLILANHPDKGGSTFLAAQINKAKEILLGNL